KGASKQEKEEVKAINKSLKETRKLENKIAKAKNEDQIQKALENFDKKVSKINNGQKVSTYVKVAKSLGLNASIGALQANFGTPQETGILELQNQIQLTNSLISSLPNQIQSAELTINNLSQSISGLNGSIDTLQNEIDGLNTQINQIDEELTNTELTEEQIEDLNNQRTSIENQISDTQNSLDSSQSELNTNTNQLNTTNQNLNNFQTELETATTSLPQLEQQLSETIENVNIGQRDSSWTTVNLDANNDGIIDENDIQ
ncbi:hypothetical protein OAS68_01850, partial [Candidatus Pelagibacter sp.]|nr:hypothetical protein [Candidatus Pelagibacter sp.]